MSLSQLTTSLVGRTIPLDPLRASIACDSLPYFVHRFWKYVEPARPLQWNWHLDEWCKVLTLARNGICKRIDINTPPGSSKSLLISVFFNAWIWASDPALRVITVSYNPDNTVRDNLKLRSIIRSDEYQNTFWKGRGVTLSSSQDAKERFDTSLSGYRIASSIKGTLTGEHPDFMIWDDLMKAQDATSEVKLQEVRDFISNVASTRYANDPCIINVQQRLNELDASGYLRQKGGWMHVVFPMRYESTKVSEYDQRDIPDPRDHRTKEGELLWPTVLTEEKIREAENMLGPLSSGQLQQNPIPLEGTLFKREFFPIVDVAPKSARRCRGWDIAETDNGGDETWGVRLSLDDGSGLIYVEDGVWDQVTLTDKLIKQVAEVDGRGCKVREGAGSGKAVTKARSILLQGWDYGVSPETESKTARANPFLAQCRAGNVRMVRGEWNEAYLNRVCAFPFGRYDDPVDASSNAANELMGVVKKRKRRLTWRRKSRYKVTH